MLAVTLAGPKVMADEGQGIPLPVGHFSLTQQGSVASCQTSNGVPEPCNTPGVVGVAQSVLNNGTVTRDSAGNACSANIGVLSTLPPGATPSFVLAAHTSLKVTNYDPVTGTGDESSKSWSGGVCNGAIFDKTGATQISSGTDHFVVTNDGNRIDSLFTAVVGVPTSPLAFVGGFSATRTELRQITQQQ
jgi:hypothetical protein